MMKRSYQLFGAAVLALGSLATFAAPISLIANGGFETGDFTSWTVVASSTTNGSGSSPSLVSGGAHTGTFAARFPDGSANITQTFAAVPVADISEVSFWAEKAADSTLSFGLAAITFRYVNPADNNTIVFTTGADWTLFDATSYLVAGQDLIGIRLFGGAQSPPPPYPPAPTSFYPGYIDDVRVIANVPEPGTLALLTLGLAGLAASRRRKQ